MLKDPDKLDAVLLEQISENPGHSISETIRPFLTIRSEANLRYRIRALELRKLIRHVTTKNSVLLYAAVEDGDVDE